MPTFACIRCAVRGGIQPSDSGTPKRALSRAEFRAARSLAPSAPTRADSLSEGVAFGSALPVCSGPRGLHPARPNSKTRQPKVVSPFWGYCRIVGVGSDLLRYMFVPDRVKEALGFVKCKGTTSRSILFRPFGRRVDVRSRNEVMLL
jgi:hypothetical protein